MSAPSHLTVMHQVRHNVLADLMARSADSEFHRQELKTFLALEPVTINSDIYFNLANSNHTTLGMVRFESPVILRDNPKPKLEGLNKQHFKNYVRQWVRYIFVGILVRYLPRVLTFEPQVKPLTIVSKDFTVKDK